MIVLRSIIFCVILLFFAGYSVFVYIYRYRNIQRIILWQNKDIKNREGTWLQKSILSKEFSNGILWLFDCSISKSWLDSLGCHCVHCFTVYSRMVWSLWRNTQNWYSKIPWLIESKSSLVYSGNAIFSTASSWYHFEFFKSINELCESCSATHVYGTLLQQVCYSYPE